MRYTLGLGALLVVGRAAALSVLPDLDYDSEEAPAVEKRADPLYFNSEITQVRSAYYLTLGAPEEEEPTEAPKPVINPKEPVEKVPPKTTVSVYSGILRDRMYR